MSDLEKDPVQSTDTALTRTKFCKHCGEKINVDAVVCNKCGLQVEELKSAQPSIVVNNSNVSTNMNTGGVYGRPKSKWVALILCFFLGFLGVHRFYEGKIGTGLLYFFTWGLFGVGVLIDFIIILCKPDPYYV
jgi:iron only hydrogenase large subunit-like protein